MKQAQILFRPFRKKHRLLRLAEVLFLITLFFAMPAFAEAVPGDACSTAGATRLAGGVETSGVGYYMVCQGGVWVKVFESDTSGTVTFNGGLVVGASMSTSCTAGTEGAIRYNSTGKTIEVCDGSDWAGIQASACDNAPAFLAFPTLTAQGTSTLVTSSILAVTGMDAGCTTSVGVSGDGSPEYRTCSDSGCSSVLQAWTAANNTLDIQGNYIQLRATTSASTDTSFTITLDTGSTSSDWIITTGLSACAPIGSVCADGSVYAGLSGSNPMYVTRCDAGQTWGGSSCDGIRSTLTWNDGSGVSSNTTTSVIDQADGQTNTASLVTIDSNSVADGQQPHAAAQYCNDLVLHGHSDWYLPAKNELNTVYNNRAAIGNFDESGPHYWSSSEDTSANAWTQRFSSGSYVYYTKYSTNVVRCARHD